MRLRNDEGVAVNAAEIVLHSEQKQKRSSRLLTPLLYALLYER